MNPFEMVIGIVLIVTIGSIIRAKYGVRRDHRGGEYFVAQDNAETKALQAEIRALKERIQVLERIATDHNRAASLDEEIEKLRLQIMQVQLKLTGLSLYEGPIDGVMNHELAEGVRHFQTLKGMRDTGMLTTGTLTALGIHAID